MIKRGVEREEEREVRMEIDRLVQTCVCKRDRVCLRERESENEYL